jgi:hypothetical protein
MTGAFAAAVAVWQSRGDVANYSGSDHLARDRDASV